MLLTVFLSVFFPAELIKLRNELGATANSGVVHACTMHVHPATEERRRDKLTPQEDTGARRDEGGEARVHLR